MDHIDDSLKCAERAFRVTSDSMYDPADPYHSLMAGDVVMVDKTRVPQDGDYVVVSVDGGDLLMKLAINNGARHFRFTAPDHSGFCLNDADAAISGIVTEFRRSYATHLTGPLKWRGDDIGLCNGSPIRVHLEDCNGRAYMLFLREALMAFDMLDAYGMQRITLALSHAAAGGCLRSMDLAVWSEFKSDREFVDQYGAHHE